MNFKHLERSRNYLFFKPSTYLDSGNDGGVNALVGLVNRMMDRMADEAKLSAERSDAALRQMQTMVTEQMATVHRLIGVVGTLVEGLSVPAAVSTPTVAEEPKPLLVEPSGNGQKKPFQLAACADWLRHPAPTWTPLFPSVGAAIAAAKQRAVSATDGVAGRAERPASSSPPASSQDWGEGAEDGQVVVQLRAKTPGQVLPPDLLFRVGEAVQRTGVAVVDVEREGSQGQTYAIVVLGRFPPVGGPFCPPGPSGDGAWTLTRPD
ncbi:hypothetical protein pipiens_006685 [Culex pipiens pipiens]|uniref:Uncharacterized protein n=1 Tax=Culex pipiens pipiens TaxID=38569 RepID=A0ABD1DPK6_CULPP